MVKDLLCNEKNTIRQALTLIDKNQKGVVFVVDDSEVLTGVVTDGDIRRSLLGNATLETTLDVIRNENFVYAPITADSNTILKLLSVDIKIIPLVNEKMQVVDYSEHKKLSGLPIAEPCLNGKELDYVIDAVASTWISSTGKYILEFEEKFAEYCGVRYGVATSNGTTALHLALVTLGIGPGDEVIVPDITFAATINAVLYTGATPVIVDIEEESWCIDPKEIEKAISPRTKAIIPVHIYGQPCDMEAIMKTAKDNNLYVVEDCAEAHGAEFKEKRVGSFGDISCFSFFGNKVITTGEGGMCITNNEEYAERMKLYRDHGMSKKRKYYHEVIGFNYRMTNIQAAIGVAQLEGIDMILEERRRLEELYRKHLQGTEGVYLQRNDLTDRKKVTWLVTVYADSVERKEKCMEHMKQENIDARSFFVPLSQMEIYRKYVFSNNVSCKIAERGFNLPTTYKMDEEDVKRVVKSMKKKGGL